MSPPVHKKSRRRTASLSAEQQALLDAAWPPDRARLGRQAQTVARHGTDSPAWQQWQSQAASSAAFWQSRLSHGLDLQVPEELPIAARTEEITRAIADHQVVVVAGETGSGKTTQLPKLALAAGRGVDGLIGHTQPRRLAARSVALRLAEEFKVELGSAVGYQVRFHAQVRRESYIKLMTDGILLAEIPHDPMLSRYDTLIIDEAHERSLNIDFILGYLKRLLPKRPDLKLIITSATIDTARFAEHFDRAPVIEVSGRTYPVQVRYRPLQGDEQEWDRDLIAGVLDGVDECARCGPGDILVFLPGEREIRDCAEALRKHHPPGTEILPLYARLSARDQQKVFKPAKARRVVLATNVAETSLTVPGIRFVVDSGLARMSRYNSRTKVQRLPIEKISQASANQRKGRCGRVAAGVCVRLFSEDDFTARPQYTEPEIQRTNLAAVILQMKLLGLGEIKRFPFIEPPVHSAIKDGYRVLRELQALDERDHITAIGKKMARLPVDPRYARMLLAAVTQQCLSEVLIIVSALAVQDPRERPLDKQQQADEAHKPFKHERSDFLDYLLMWRQLQEWSRHLSKTQFRKRCSRHYLSWRRVQDWRETHGQMHGLLAEMGFRSNPLRQLDDERDDASDIHQALLTGLLSHVGLKDEDKTYISSHGKRLTLFPASSLANKPPKWIMAAEVVETSRVFARINAPIEARWIEPLAGHLLKRSYSEPHWQPERGFVGAYESVTLFGLPIVTRRRVHYGPIDPKAARQLFIQSALVEGKWHGRLTFWQHNQALIERLRTREHKARRPVYLADETTRYEFYDARVPQTIHTIKDLEQWYRTHSAQDANLLCMQMEQLVRPDAPPLSAQEFPDSLNLAGMRLPLAYRNAPGEEDDGVSLMVPMIMLSQIDAVACQWLVPGYRQELLTAYIRALPKNLRRQFVPAPDRAARALARIEDFSLPVPQALADALRRISGIRIDAQLWREVTLPLHLQMRFVILDEQGQTIASGRDLDALRQRFAGTIARGFTQVESDQWQREDISAWDFGDLPEVIDTSAHGVTVRAHPALTEVRQADQWQVDLRLFDTPAQARHAHQRGVLRLFLLQHAKQVRYLQKAIPQRDKLALLYSDLGDVNELLTQIIEQTAADSLLAKGLPTTASEYSQAAEYAAHHWVDGANELAHLLLEVFELTRQVRRHMRRLTQPACLAALQDVEQQLQLLLTPGFVARTALQELRCYPRYLQAILRRLDKLAHNLARDRQLMQQLTPHWQRWLDQFHAVEHLPPKAVQYRWMVEEMRVSLFAQELKTAYPVSSKRLDKLWQELSREF